MKCPYCTSTKNRVVDTREIPDGIRRRRECLNCRMRYTTHEQVATVSMLVVKNDGRREMFDRDKLFNSMRIACTKRPISAGVLELATEQVESELYMLGKAEIPSMEIGQLVMTHLQRIDDIAYIRFASVYNQVEDVAELAIEIQKLMERKNHDESHQKRPPYIQSEC
ncbi:MAG: transcriptional regulator NrdR [Anaerolineaceae bacterium 4572_78]|nr:MAG: transcriptional regulator NrdR [Anaerolineaceae bacterium 4572_78]